MKTIKIPMLRCTFGYCDGEYEVDDPVTYALDGSGQRCPLHPFAKLARSYMLVRMPETAEENTHFMMEAAERRKTGLYNRSHRRRE